jgi:hypothetical protein
MVVTVLSSADATLLSCSVIAVAPVTLSANVWLDSRRDPPFTTLLLAPLCSTQDKKEVDVPGAPAASSALAGGEAQPQFAPKLAGSCTGAPAGSMPPAGSGLFTLDGEVPVGPVQLPVAAACTHCGL